MAKKKEKQEPLSKHTEALSVDLTQEELDERRDKLVKLIEDSTELEIEKKAATAQFNARKQKLTSAIGSIAIEVRERKTYRPVDCAEMPDYKAGIVTIVRQDTGEIVRTRVMTDEDRQAKIALVKEKAEETVKDKKKAEEKTDSKPEDDLSEMFYKAKEAVVETRQAKCSMLQHRLRIGYQKALQLLTELEQEGIVSAPDEAGHRIVLIAPDQTADGEDSNVLEMPTSSDQ